MWLKTEIGYEHPSVININVCHQLNQQQQEASVLATLGMLLDRLSELAFLAFAPWWKTNQTGKSDAD